MALPALAGRAIDEGRKMGTVGAVALDAHGHLAAATSTGGMTNRAARRLGDSPLIGCGTYADDRTAAGSCTGDGESLIRRGCRGPPVCARMAYGGASLESATQAVVHEALPAVQGTGGLIAVDRQGNVCLPFNTEGMYPRHCACGAGARILYLPLSVRTAAHTRDRFFPMASHMKSTSSTVTSSLILPEQRVLAVSDMTVRFANSERTVDAVRNLSFHVDRGETLAIVGESGSGKSVTSLALMRLVEHGGGKIVNGSAALRRRNGQVLDVVKAGNATMRDVRGADVAMIFQEPMTSLNPVFTAGEQIAESIRNHQGMDRAAARAEALRMLDLVRIPEARNVLDRFPHQLSGGMRQRVMIAMALACKPQLLIADEPTTALDVTIQAQILQLIRQLQDEMHMGVIFITHDMGVVAEVADRVLVMYRGDKVEEGESGNVFAAPQHAYTRALLSAVPKLGAMRGTDLPRQFDLLRADGTVGSVHGAGILARRHAPCRGRADSAREKPGHAV